MTPSAARIGDATSLALAIVVAAPSLYLAMLAAIARRVCAPRPARTVRFDVIVPAHNEEAGIATTIASLLDVDYPRSHFRVIVIADNCTDATASRAIGAGAEVIVRHDADHRGKGHALATAFAASARANVADAVVVVDADTTVSRNLLTAFAARVVDGTDAMQAEYGVRNPASSWRTRLTVIAFALFHTTRSLGRERLGLSCGLRGNGMCFTHSLLRRVPHDATSVVEDIEYGIELGLRGVRVAYVGDACVAGEMPSDGSAARSQRERWEGGRALLVRRYALRLLRSALARRELLTLDLAADLIVPPLTFLAIASVSGTLVSVYSARHAGSALAAAVWTGSTVALLAYVGRGVQLSRLGLRAIVDLAWAPVYAAWKITLLLRPRRRGVAEWVRTARRGDG